MTQTTQPTIDHDVTSPNTVAHWVLYTLDAIEAAGADEEGRTPRDAGITPDRIYEFAAGEDSIVFNSKQEISSALSRLAKDGVPWKPESRPVNRRTHSTDWDEHDVKYRYRLNDYGRRVLLDLGTPDKLPNRHDLGDDDRMLGVKPSHEPGWWRGNYTHFDNEWDIRNHDWNSTDHDRIFYKDDGDELMADNRGYHHIPKKLVEAFPDVTFVLTVGPHRPHDLMYAIRDPWNKVVQIDVYSPMSIHRSTEEITENFEALVTDLHKGLHVIAENDPTG